MTIDRRLKAAASRHASRGIAIAALLFVYVAVRVFWWYDTASADWWRDSPLRSVLDSDIADGVFKLVAWVASCLVVTASLHRLSPSRTWKILGFTRDSQYGLLFGVVATLPLAIAVLTTNSVTADPGVLIATALLGPFAEEVLFRGFLFRELHQHARWPLGWAIGISALAFGFAHVPHLDVLTFDAMRYYAYPYVAREFSAAMAQVAMMTAGGAVFAWVCHRSGSIWPSIALHGLINLWLTLSTHDVTRQVHIDAVGVAQVLAFVLAIAFTFRQRPASPVASPAPLS